MVGRGRWQVDVLGPLRVQDASGRDVTPPGILQRRLLALLVLHRGHVVSVDAALDALWPTAPPADPTAALQNHVSRLRRMLPDTIDSVAGGYRLDPAAVELDADRLTTWVADDGEPSDPTGVDDLLQRWSGPAYPDLDEVDDGRVEAARLAELRTATCERRAEQRLAAGDVDGLVSELTRLAADEPLRERPRALLMATLAASGRQAEALRVYDDFRRRLGHELGTTPSPSLVAQRDELLAGAAEPVPAFATRLPEPASSLVGRDVLAADLTALVGGTRLLTLVGPGGVGKTRLLLEIGRRLRSSEHPVVLCELAVADASSAQDAVAAALRIDARAGTPLIDRLTDVVADSEVVVLLDNCEHVLAPIAVLVDALLTRCPNVRVVATSRERLRVAGEHVRSVPTLTADDGDAPAVALFLERARSVAPDFAPDDGQLGVVLDLVRRLDGLPLAIELAAARLHTDDVEDVAAGLDRRFALLSTGTRTSERHGSLAAAVAWSFEQLDDDLADVFAALSVFAGAFTTDDAAAVCALDRAAASDALAQLVERSLVMRAPGRHYVLLETLRAFGAEQLAGRRDEVAGRHAHHQVAWIARAHRRVAEPGAALTEIDAALPELRNALAWLVDHRELEAAGRLVNDLFIFGFLRLRPDVLAWAETVTVADPDDVAEHAAAVWTVAGYASWMAGDLDEMARRTARARRLAERDGTASGAVVLLGLGASALFDGRVAEAADWFGRASAIARPTDPALALTGVASEVLARGYAADPGADELADAVLVDTGAEPTAVAAYAWYCAGEADLTAGRLGRAGERFERALAMAAATSASLVTGSAGASKASIDARTGDPLAAAADYRRLIDHWRRAGMWSTQWTMLRSIAGLLARLDRPADAAVLAGAVRATSVGHRLFGADEQALAELDGRLRAALGDEAFEAARGRGAVLDGDAAVEHALRALPG